MPVLGALSVRLEVPRLEDGVKFCRHAGLKLSDRRAQAEGVTRLKRHDYELGPNGLARELA